MEEQKNLFVQMFEMAETLAGFPDITENAQTGVWYRVPLEGCVCGNGEPYYVSLKIGVSKGLIVNFHGGGVAWNAYTAARPMAPENYTGEGFYFDRVEPCSDPVTSNGILGTGKENIFRDWSVLCLNYASGDFHTGTSDFEYKALDGSKRVLYHHGYLNFQKALEITRPFFPKPEKIIICGESAGGFAAYSLADDIIREFGECGNITVCADGSHLCYDGWKKTAVGQWRAPKHITDIISEKNYTLGCMLGLYGKYGNRINYLYTSSTRDGALGDFQQMLYQGTRGFTKHGGDLAETVLTEMIQRLEKEIPSCGLYLYDDILYPGVPVGENLTLHTILLTDYAHTYNLHGRSPMEWLNQAVEGNVEKMICGKMQNGLVSLKQN